MNEEDPIARFSREYSKAGETEPFDAGRCALATVDVEARPSVRFVLLKGFDEHGFVFYTNFASHKARDLEANPHAALAFHWHTTGVQVRVRGAVFKTSDEVSDAYFATRDRGSQLGAWASKQSNELDDPTTLKAEVDALAKRFAGAPVPRPRFWGGYRILPDAIEFWENRSDRLHERWLYARTPEGWGCSRLYP